MSPIQIARDEAAATWRTPPARALMMWAMPFVLLAICAGLRLLARPLWRTIIADEGPIELVQFGFLAGAGVCCSFAAYHLRRHGERVGAALYAIGFLGLFFIAGEEIAWGQFLLGFETPESLAEVNYKAETSLHNVSSLADAFELGKVAAGIYGLFGAWVLLWLRRTREIPTLDWVIVPVFLSSSFGLVLLSRIARVTIFTTTPAGLGEVEELVFSFGMFAFTGFVWRRARHASALPASGSDPIAGPLEA